MKGLILKDFYLLSKYCRSFLLIIVIFSVVSFSGEKSTFFVFYPCILTGMLPMTLYSYDEREKWNIFSLSLPVSKADYVSAKYIVGLICSVAVIILIVIAQTAKAIVSSTFEIQSILYIVQLLFTIALSAPAILMPVIFKFGMEKGRFAYYIIIGLACAFGVFFSNYKFASIISYIKSPVLFTFLFSVLIFALSWILSIKLYKSREF